MSEMDNSRPIGGVKVESLTIAIVLLADFTIIF